MKTTFLCLVVIFIICQTATAGRKNRGENRGRSNRRGSGRAPHHMCAGVMRRAGMNPRTIDCTDYDTDVQTDLDAIYRNEHERIFQSWMSMIDTMTRQEMEADDDDVTEAEDDNDDNEDALMTMCKRKACFMKKLKEHIQDPAIEVPEFCKAKTEQEWRTLKEANRPEPGQPRQPMSVERYTTIFCTKAYQLDKGQRTRGHGGRGRGGKGRGRQGGRRGGRPDTQEVPQ